MKKFLQNHPGYTAIPTSSLRVVCEAITTIQRKPSIMSPLMTAFYIIFMILAIMGLGIFGLLIYVILDSSVIEFSLKMGVVLAALALPVLIFIGIIGSLCKRVKSEQYRYYQTTGRKPLTIEQRAALRLDLVMIYNMKGWAETLEFMPVKEFVAGDTYQYRALMLTTQESHRSGVFSDWGIVDRQGYREAMESLWQGMHSSSFALTMARVPAEERINHSLVRKLAALLEIPSEKIIANIDSYNGKAPALLWGFDLRRAIYLSRICYGAGIISEEEAWEDLLKTSRYIHAIFPDFDSYHQNYLLGYAYWMMDFEAIKARRNEYEHFKKTCKWQMKDLPWHPESQDVLLQFMRDGFQEGIAMILKSEAGNQAAEALEVEKSGKAVLSDKIVEEEEEIDLQSTTVH
ncbi:DUF1266 domain-containing protein [Ignatzschineria rhizosphaerae]|uniref:DUF1266 domain-containing protein n=2 Tax=Ignatzschineria rhizosphaerae TaxID=2923279 RepID=A0ABY3X5J5_9GAMM|nr:DUF1266 domain-containing protein [Ignatzschineria rhizosphaerae]UNM97041.1 DUF1266 domain-containing protein [Ignatzschineria rhizosphaerae]